MNYIEILNIIVSAIGVMVGVFVSYHVYVLSKQESFSHRLKTRDLIQKKIDELLYKINNGGNSKVEIINIKKYNKHYPHDNNKNRHGYTYNGAELKSYSFEGIEFFCGIKGAYRSHDNNYTSKQLAPGVKKETIYVTGVIPYEWIEYVDLKGDDTTLSPQIYSHYLGENKSLFKKHRYYTNKDVSTDNFKEISYKK